MNPDKGIRGIRIFEFTLLTEFGRFFFAAADILFFDDLFALYQTFSAIRTVLLPFSPGCAATRTGIVINNLCPLDLFPTGSAKRRITQVNGLAERLEDRIDKSDRAAKEEEQTKQTVDPVIFI